MTSPWRRGIEARLAGREHVSTEMLAREGWSDLPESDVIEVLHLFATEADVDIGLLRPGDAIGLLFDPPPTKNPWRWLWYQGHAGDSSFEIGLQIDKRLKKYGTKDLWRDSIKTLDDFVRAWCGARP